MAYLLKDRNKGRIADFKVIAVRSLRGGIDLIDCASGLYEGDV